MAANLAPEELNTAQFNKIVDLVHRLCGIKLQEGKEMLVQARLTKRLRELGLGKFEDYLEHVECDRSGGELSLMLDLLTTNKTSFFREMRHFEYLRRQVLPRLKAPGKKIRFWSAGCSSGEEPYSLAIQMREEIPDIDCRGVRILATDISTRMLDKARQATYPRDTLADVPAPLVQRYFTRVEGKAERLYRVAESVSGMVQLARLNLLDPWPMKGPFDVILCRNVMIYFDRPTREALVSRFWELLQPGGHLFLGLSESLMGGTHGLRYVEPAVYVR